MAKKPISHNYYRGKRLRSVEELRVLALNDMSVYHKNWGIKPAKVVINLPFHSIMGAIEGKMLYYTTK